MPLVLRHPRLVTRGIDDGAVELVLAMLGLTPELRATIGEHATDDEGVLHQGRNHASERVRAIR
jgi:hypothetical protein